MTKIYVIFITLKYKKCILCSFIKQQFPDEYIWDSVDYIRNSKTFKLFAFHFPSTKLYKKTDWQEFYFEFRIPPFSFSQVTPISRRL